MGKVNADVNYTITRFDSPTNVIGFIKSGKLHVKIDNQEYLLTKGNSFILLHNSEYQIFSDEDDPPIMYWCNIRGILFDLITDMMSFNKFSFSSIDLEKLFYELILLISQQEDKFYDISEIVISIICRIEKNKIKDTSQNLVSERNLSKDFEMYISNHIQENFSVEKMSADFGLSTDTINRIFKTTFNKTPYQFYQNLRIDIAKTMLLNSDLTIDDISARLNFTDRNYFSIIFKKGTGYSPAQFRKIKPQS